MNSLTTPRRVVRVIPSVRTVEGAGFVVRRPFPTRALDHFDPFLLLDEMGPVDLEPGEAKGAPDHPHRGFETVTYVLEGRMQHRDSQGNEGELGPGDVQWMTAGAGVVHAEMPHPELERRGGRMHGFQLWVNLPKRDKMMRPRYQEIPSSRIPEARADNGATVRVIAGDALGANARIDTRTPITYLHWTLPPGARIEQPLPPTWNAFLYPFDGALEVGPEGKRVAEGDLAMLAPEGDGASFAAPRDGNRPTQVLLLAGEPLREPVARYGPFVMNTSGELMEALEDFRAGRMGSIAPARDQG